MEDRDLRTSSGMIDGIAYETAGGGPSLLFIHSGIADSRMWEPQWTAFAAEFRVVRVDLRGFGKSGPRRAGAADHDDIVRVMDHLGVDSAVLVGSSFGGNVAVDLALTHPARVRALVLAATLAGMIEPGPELTRVWEESEAAFEAGELDRGVEIELRAWVDGPRRTPEQVDPDVRAFVRTMNRAIWERAAAEEQIADDAPEIDRARRLGEIKIPALLIEGELDQPSVEASMNRLAGELARAERVVVRGAAHFPNLEGPESFNDAARAFLARLPETKTGDPSHGKDRR